MARAQDVGIKRAKVEVQLLRTLPMPEETHPKFLWEQQLQISKVVLLADFRTKELTEALNQTMPLEGSTSLSNASTIDSLLMLQKLQEDTAEMVLQMIRLQILAKHALLFNNDPKDPSPPMILDKEMSTSASLHVSPSTPLCLTSSFCTSDTTFFFTSSTLVLLIPPSASLRVPVVSPAPTSSISTPHPSPMVLGSLLKPTRSQPLGSASQPVMVSSSPSSLPTPIPHTSGTVSLSIHQGDPVPQTDSNAPIIRNKEFNLDLEFITAFAIQPVLKTTQAAKAPSSALAWIKPTQSGKAPSQPLPNLSISG
eukprot:Gb_16447 [translate_table: standard]